MGILAGMRSAAAPAIASHILREKPTATSVNNSLGSAPSVAIADVLKLMALGEFVADKLPFIPNRTQPFSIAVRCISGALAGAGIFNAAGKKALTGAILGGFIAGASTYASFFMRKKLSHSALGNFLSGVLEDAVVVGAGAKLAHTV